MKPNNLILSIVVGERRERRRRLRRDARGCTRDLDPEAEILKKCTTIHATPHHQQLTHTHTLHALSHANHASAAQNKFARDAMQDTRTRLNAPPPPPPPRHAKEGATGIARGRGGLSPSLGAEVLPVDHHEPLHARERVLLHLRVGVLEDGHDGPLGTVLRHEATALGVVLDEPG